MADGNVAVKEEPFDASDLEARIILLCQQNPKGITDEVIQNDRPSVTPQQRVMALNRLLSQTKIDLLKSGSTLVYRLKDSGGSSKGADTQERMVYQVISEAGNKGIWLRDIRFKTNLVMPTLNKILKSLETQKLIKAVKSVSAVKRKVYMLYNLEPDRSITGGTWYSDQDFESEFVEVLNQQCFKFLEHKAALAKDSKTEPMVQRNAAFVPSTEIWKYISELGISKVQLSLEDVEAILNTLVFDGKVETQITSGGGGDAGNHVKLYRSMPSLISSAAIACVPCGVCPIRQSCHEGGDVSPSKCVYMNEWLDY